MCWVALIPAAMAMVGAMSDSKAKKEQAEYQGEIAKNNAMISQYQANDASRRGAAAAQDHMQKVAQIRGAQTTSLAARGLDIGEGSSLALLQDTDLMGQRDKNQILQNAGMERWGLDIQTGNFNESAKMMQQTADNINPMMDGLMAGGKSFIGNGGFGGGGGTVSDKNADYLSRKNLTAANDGLVYDLAGKR